MDKHSSGRKRGKSFLDLLKAWQTPSERRRSGEYILPEPSNADLVLSELDIPAVAKDKVPSSSAEGAVTIAAGVTDGDPATGDLASEINGMVAVVASPSVTTDKPDYSPGEEAVITASGFKPGATLSFEVDHVSAAGADGVYGSLDDQVIEMGGAGHQAWVVTDGGTGDGDGSVNGSIVTQWYVNPDDSANQRFLLTAKETVPGHDGVFGTADDLYSAYAAATFTDAVLDLTLDGSKGALNGSWFAQSGAESSAGTGLIQAFVRVQKDGTEQGYNTDYRPLQFDENSSPSFTKSLAFADVPIVDPGSIDGSGKYFEFRLDINQTNNNPLISLDRLQLYLGNAANLSGFNNDPTQAANGFGTNAKLVYNLDGNANNTIYLNYALEAGSGQSDMFFYVPVELVYGTDGVAGGTGSNADIADLSVFNNVYLYSQFGAVGGDYAANDGFEEWSVSKKSNLSLSGYKWEDANGNGEWDSGEHGLGGWQIFVDYNNNGIEDGQDGYVVTNADSTFDANGDGVANAQDVGFYSLPILIPLDKNNSTTITVGERLQSDWVNTYDGPDAGTDGTTLVVLPKDSKNPKLPSGTFGDTELLNFGNFKTFEISGYKFIDIVGDGVWGLVDPLDPNGDKDPGEKGWTINLSVDTDKSGTLNAGDAFITSDVTDETGQYQFTGLGPLKPGEQYIVWESPFPEGDTALDWTQTFNTPGYYLFDPVSGQSFAGVEGSSVLDEDGEGPGKGNFGNFKNLDLGCYKWIDTNGNGAWDEREAGANDWIIYLDNDEDLSNGFIRTETTTTEAGTGYEGFYEFQNITPEEIDGALTLYVYEEIRPGFVKTFGGYTFDVQSGEIVRSDYGIAQTGNFGNFELFDISGTKFVDVNADGEISDEEKLVSPGVSFTFELYERVPGRDDKLVDTTISDPATGKWAFTGLAPINVEVGVDADGNAVFALGQYVVKEQENPDWTQSYGNDGYIITPASGVDSTDNDFANYQNFTKSGIKYEDFNANGIKDEGDVGLEDWVITAFIDANDDGTLQQSEIDFGAAAIGTTDATGAYSLSLKPGVNYIVVETEQPDWFESPDGDAALVNAVGLSVFGQYGYVLDAATVISGGSESDNDFANYQNFTKSGIKYEDFNANGIKDEGDVGLEDWVITAFIDANDDGTLQQSEIDFGAAAIGTTDATGAYSLSLKPGVNYIVVETEQPDWFESPDGDAALVNAVGLSVFGQYGYVLDAATVISGGSESDNDFANYQNFTKSGIKYEDFNANGIKDEGDVGLEDWVITAFIDANDDGTLQQSEIDFGAAAIGTTDATGAYSLSLKPGVNYIVVETEQPDWFESPDGDAALVNAVGLSVFGQYGYVLDAATVISGGSERDNDFANYQYATKSGVKFNDLITNGVRDAGEAGLADWQINIQGTAGDGTLVNQSVMTADGVTDDLNGDGQIDEKGFYWFSVKPGDYTVSEVQQDGWRQTAPDIPGDGDWDIVLTSGQNDTGNDFGNVRVGACGLTPGFWLGGAANPKVKGQTTTSIWDGIANNDGGKLATLKGTISDVAIATRDVLLTAEFKNNNVVKKTGTGYAADSYQNPVTADFALGIQGSLRDFNNDGKLDQIYIEHFDARKILGTAYQPGDRFGALLRKDLAMILDIAGQQDYVQVTELRSAIYDWVGYNAFNAKDNFTGPIGDGILTKLEDPGNLGNNDYDVNSDGADDWVINYQAASNNKSAGFGADGKFTVLGSSAAWTTGGNTLPTPPDVPETTYSGQLLFNVLSAQFEGSCNLDVTLDGAHVLTQDANGLTSGIYDNNGNLSMISSMLPSYGV